MKFGKKKKKEKENAYMRNIIIAAFGGLLAGALTGLLLAPFKGKETRQKLMDEVDDWGENLKEGVNSGMDKISEFKEKLMKETTAVPSNGEEETKKAK